MNKLQEIQEPIQPFLDGFAQSYDAALQSRIPIITEAVTRLNQSTGKRIRPILVGLMAHLCGKVPTETTVEVALVLELMHTSSLIHDDVIDESLERRAQPTLNSIFNNHTAVLVGDFVIASALRRASSKLSIEVVQTISTIACLLSEGELMQIDLVRRAVSTEQEYFEVIEKKTAILFSASCSLGAYSVGADSDMQQCCAEIGRLLGIAFQMRDDILDYSNAIETGKPRGNDLREGKATLPLLYALKQASDEDQSRIRSLMHLPVGDEAVEEIINFSILQGGLTYTQQKIDSYIQQAYKLLESFPESKAKESLLALARFIGERTF